MDRSVSIWREVIELIVILQEILAFPEIVLQRAERYSGEAGDAPH